MALDFPNSPTVGQIFFNWKWDGTKWTAAGTGGGGGGAAQTNFDTAAQVQTTSISSSVNSLRTAGYSSIGDGGAALYKRVASMPAFGGSLHSADGAWLQLAETSVLNALMFGIVGDGTTDNTTGFSGLQSYCKTSRQHWTVNFNPGTYL